MSLEQDGAVAHVRKSGMLKLILIITIGAPNLSLMEQAYTEHLNYSVVARGQVSSELAQAWDTSRMVGRDYMLMQPESKARIYLRFVEVASVDGYGAMKTFGWNATEILVQDPDALAEVLRGPNSPFRIIGEPRPLSATSNVRAMQVVGPAQEVVYLTRIPPSDSAASLGSAQTYVDRPFIVILGGPDMAAMRQFYQEVFGVSVSEIRPARMTVLNKAHGFDIEQTHPLAMARVSPQYGIEIDGYPETATIRAHRYAELPPAMAMVSFEIASLEDLPLTAPPRIIEQFPYNGRKVGVMHGAAGELIELIETPSP